MNYVLKLLKEQSDKLMEAKKENQEFLISGDFEMQADQVFTENAIENQIKLIEEINQVIILILTEKRKVLRGKKTTKDKNICTKGYAHSFAMCTKTRTKEIRAEHPELTLPIWECSNCGKIIEST